MEGERREKQRRERKRKGKNRNSLTYFWENLLHQGEILVLKFLQNFPAILMRKLIHKSERDILR
jgi:hypothetical protein